MMPGKGQVEAGGGGKIRRYTVISEDFHDWMSHMSGSVTGSITRRNMTCLEAVLFRGLQAGRYVNHKHASGQMKDQDQHKVVTELVKHQHVIHKYCIYCISLHDVQELTHCNMFEVDMCGQKPVASS